MGLLATEKGNPMSGEFKVKAFVEIRVAQKFFYLPDDYMNALARYTCGDPVSFYLPWPLELFPEESEEITFSSFCRHVDVVVERVSYSHSATRGFVGNARVTDWNDGQFCIQSLLEFATAGMIPESHYSLEHILHASRLPSTMDTYRAAGRSFDPDDYKKR